MTAYSSSNALTGQGTHCVHNNDPRAAIGIAATYIGTESSAPLDCRSLFYQVGHNDVGYATVFPMGNSHVLGSQDTALNLTV